MSGDLEQISQAVVEGEEIARRAWETVSGTALGDELVATVADPIRYRRGRRQVHALVKMQQVIDEAGLTGKVVPDRTLFPLLEFVAREDEETMIDRWANLLAHAAVGDVAVPGLYLEALGALDPVEASWIDRLVSADPWPANVLIPIWAYDPGQSRVIRLRLERLARNGLLIAQSDASPSDRGPWVAACETDRPEPDESVVDPSRSLTSDRYMLTDLGRELVRLCRPPRGA